MERLNHLCVAALAAVDSVFWPDRRPHPGAPSYVARCERRWNYAAHGIPWHAPEGAGAAARVEHERERDSLEQVGFIRVLRSRGRAAGIQLTEAGEFHGRALAGLPQLWEAPPLIDRLEALLDSPRGADAAHSKWTREDELFGREYAAGGTAADWEADTERMLPLLIRGAVEANADMQGHVWYRLTGRGVDPAAKRFDLPEPSAEAAKLYYRTFDDERAAVERARPTARTEIGAILIPVGGARG